MDASSVKLKPLRTGQHEALVRMWRESFEFGVGMRDPHPMSEQLDFLQDQVLPAYAVLTAEAESQIVGFVAANRESVSQLYVRVGFHRLGIGRLLLNWAKAQSVGSLWLYTFERNRNARLFYESQGFVVIERGFEPIWQLEDVRYQWPYEGHRHV